MRRDNLFWAVILIVGGILLLLNNLGIIQINVWGLIWPLFLVGLGLSILIRQSPGGQVEGEVVTIPLEGAEHARLVLRHAAGRLDVSAGTSAENLVEGTFGGGVDAKRQQNGNSLRVELKTPAQIIPFTYWPGDNRDWHVRLNPDIPFEVDIESGASSSRVDLRDANAKDIRIKSGVSSTEVTLPARAGYVRARIESGVASVIVNVPDNVAARIRSKSGLSSVNINTARFPRFGEDYESPDFQAAENKVEMEVSSGVGSIEVR
jgi:hypothetical protein